MLSAGFDPALTARSSLQPCNKAQRRNSTRTTRITSARPATWSRFRRRASSPRPRRGACRTSLNGLRRSEERHPDRLRRPGTPRFPEVCPRISCQVGLLQHGVAAAAKTCHNFRFRPSLFGSGRNFSLRQNEVQAAVHPRKRVRRTRPDAGSKTGRLKWPPKGKDPQRATSASPRLTLRDWRSKADGG